MHYIYTFYTPEVKTAWTDVYGVMATTMIDAANSASAAAAPTAAPEKKWFEFWK